MPEIDTDTDSPALIATFGALNAAKTTLADLEAMRAGMELHGSNRDRKAEMDRDIVRARAEVARLREVIGTRRYADHFIPCAGESPERAAAEAHADESMRAVLGDEWT